MKTTQNISRLAALILFTLITLSLATLNSLFGQNRYFIEGQATMEQVEAHLETFNHITVSQTGEEAIQADCDGATVLYQFDNNRLSSISFYHLYESRKASEKELYEALLFLERIMAVVIPVKETENEIWHYARTAGYRYDLKTYPGSGDNWTVMLKRSYDAVISASAN